MPAATARRLLLVLAAITALTLASVSSALAASGPQNGVRAFTPAAPSFIGLRATESFCSRPGSALPGSQIASGFCVAAEEGPTIAEGSADHIFRDAPGHLADDTPENRALIEGVVQPENYVRTGGGGEDLYRETLPNGTQVWAKVYNGQITNGGVNQSPLP